MGEEEVGEGRRCARVVCLWRVVCLVCLWRGTCLVFGVWGLGDQVREGNMSVTYQLHIRVISVT